MSPLSFGIVKSQSFKSAGYSIKIGSKSLFFGNSGATKITSGSIASSILGGGSLASSTTPSSGSNDDGWWTLPLPWNIFYNESFYSTVFVSTNSYITFGSGSSQLSGFSASSPALDKIMMGPADNSGQRIYYGVEGTSPNRTYRIRYEGTAATSGTLGSPNMIWEATFYENNIYQIDIQIGGSLVRNALSGAYSSSAFMTSLSTGTNTGTRIVTQTPSAFQSPWSVVQNASVDDNFINISLPFTFYLAGTGYTSTYLSSNTYFTFGGGSSQLSGFASNSPGFDKIFLGPADNSYQRIFTYTKGTEYKTIRYEGTGATSGVLNSPTILFEATFFNPAVLGGRNVIELLVGPHARSGGLFSVGSSSVYYVSSGILANANYVLEGNSNGTSWSITGNRYVSN